MPATIIATFPGSGRSRRILYVVITDEDFDAGEKPIPLHSSGKILRYKKLSSLTDKQADTFNVSRALTAQRQRNKKGKGE